MLKFLDNIPFKHRFEFKDMSSKYIVVPNFNFVLHKLGESSPVMDTTFTVENTFFDLELILPADSDKEITYYTGTYYSGLTDAKTVVFEIQKQNAIPITPKCIREILGVTEIELSDSTVDIFFQYTLLTDDQKYEISQGDPKTLRILKIKIALQSLPTLYNSLIKEESNGTNTRIRNSQSLKDLENSLRTELETLEANKCNKGAVRSMFGSVELCGFTGPKGFIVNC